MANQKLIVYDGANGLSYVGIPSSDQGREELRNYVVLESICQEESDTSVSKRILYIYENREKSPGPVSLQAWIAKHEILHVPEEDSNTS